MKTTISIQLFNGENLQVKLKEYNINNSSAFDLTFNGTTYTIKKCDLQDLLETIDNAMEFLMDNSD